MPDDREPMGRIAHATYRDWLAEQVERVYGDAKQLSAWEDLTEGMREAYMRIGSAVAAQAVHDAKLENTRRDAQLLAFGNAIPVILDALRIAAVHAGYQYERKHYRDLEEALGGGEAQERGDGKDGTP